MSMEQVLESMAKLRKLEEEKAALYVQLEKAYAIALLWPGVFKNGAARAGWQSKGDSYRDWKALKKGEEHKHHVFHITDKLGEDRRFPYSEVPVVLGGGKKLEVAS